MTKAQKMAYRLRHLILAAGIAFTIAGIVWAILPLFDRPEGYAGLVGTVLIIPTESSLAYSINLLVILGLILLAQWAFLRPGKGWTRNLTSLGKPLKTSVITAALMAALLTTGLITLVLELPNWWEQIITRGDEGEWNLLNHIIIWSVMLVIWALWALIFFLYWRQGDRYSQSGKMIRGLLAGSILEAIIAVPAHIWAVRQRDCYCCRGTYTTLVLSATVMIWAFGPGIILLYLREKYRIQKLIPPKSE